MKRIDVPCESLADACAELRSNGWRLATIAVTEPETPELRYIFVGPRNAGWKQLVTRGDGGLSMTSLTPSDISADWLEREIEDLFAIDFSGHPRLGDFVLHDNRWAEGVGPMRTDSPLRGAITQRSWQPRRVLHEEGAFVMPVGPIYSGEAEAALFLLETVGEDVVRSVPRLFYKYRGIEKLVQGRTAPNAALFVERANGTSAFAHAWTFCMAAERIAGTDVPPRAQSLRALIAEIERVRRHTAVIRSIAESTSLWVATARLLEIEEHMLRLCSELTGHRYLFGLTTPGGLARDFDDASIARTLDDLCALGKRVTECVAELGRTSTFLDRIERVGVLSQGRAREFGAVGPFARAAGVEYDLRILQPYGIYERLGPVVPTEQDGDGYARLRVLSREIDASLTLARKIAGSLPPGAVLATWKAREGEALGWTEAPAGASVQFVRLDANGSCSLLRFTPPSFRNWQCFRWVAEEFAFQDFPIILATCGLSVAESDR